MSLRRVVALAQALTMILLLAPGPHLVGPGSVQAAIAPAEPEAHGVYDAAGKGIGCVVGSRRYKGPREPRDPPWPPGAEPTPSPTPSPVPSAEPAASTDPVASTEPTADAPTALLAASGIRVAQADPAAEATPAPVVDGSDASTVPDVTSAPAPKGGKFLQGIDVSHHNGNIDYAKVRASGNRFVFIKATQDNDFIDPMFPTNLARARAAGLAAGAYHFFDYTLDGTVQADHFLDRVEAAGGIDDALPPVVDVECWAPIGSSIHAVSTARLRDFVERVYERTARMPIVYTSVHMWREVVGNAEGFEDLPLWAACWGCDTPPSLAPGWDDWAFWQTGISRIPGVGRLDGNYFGGSNKELKALKLRPLAIEAGAAATGSERVQLDLGGRDATHLRTSSDGEEWTEWSRIRSLPTARLSPTEGEQELFVQLRNGPGLRSPVYRDAILLDRSGPILTPPLVSLREGELGAGLASVPVWVRWDARDVHAGLSDAAVSVSCGVEPVQRTEAPGSAAPDELVAWDAEAGLVPGAACDVTAISLDGAGNRSRASSDGITAAVYPAGDEARPGATIEGDQVGVIAKRGPDAGRAAVTIDGEAVGLVELYAAVSTGPEIVFVADLDGGRHSIAVEAIGTSDPSSTGTTVDVDGFATLALAPQP
jgi:GH25 family lysozyme M1 (1,4-beta-N-acetylmuramidase)